jgi:hypothetical protein
MLSAPPETATATSVRASNGPRRSIRPAYSAASMGVGRMAGAARAAARLLTAEPFGLGGGASPDGGGRIGELDRELGQ